VVQNHEEFALDGLDCLAVRGVDGVCVDVQRRRNLPEKKAGRWGAGLTAKKMVNCRWLRPELVGQFEFVEWTGEGHLRHTKFVALREDKDARTIVRE
jgi:ATP-dependent DNA ligase